MAQVPRPDRPTDPPRTPDRDGRPPERAVPARPPRWAARGRRRLLVVAAGVAVLALGIAGGVWYWIASGRVSTDDAFIAGQVVQISARVAGQVQRLLVTDNQPVKTGDLILVIDPREYEAAAQQAEAQAHAADVTARNAELDARRAAELWARRLISRQAYDTTLATARSAAADAEAAHKRAAAAQLTLSFTRVTAPTAGRVTNRSVEQGAYVQVGQALMAIVAKDLWVVANFKETQLTGIRPGQPVDIEVDAYPALSFHGHVDSIQAGSGAAFSLLPPENATGNYVKIVQRVPVKIVFDRLPPGSYTLGPGMSVVPTVRVR